jgi:hypothetical protein
VEPNPLGYGDVRRLRAHAEEIYFVALSLQPEAEAPEIALLPRRDLRGFFYVNANA